MPAEVDDYLNEFSNTLGIRDSLEWFVGLLSWKGREEWRPFIEPVDESFRERTTRADVPLTLRCTDPAQPAAWWHYRLPPGVGPDVRLQPSLSPRQFVSQLPPRTAGLRSLGHVWELAERRGGTGAMTDGELSRWATLTARNAAAANPSQWWQDQDQAVRRELQRRAADTD